MIRDQSFGGTTRQAHGAPDTEPEHVTPEGRNVMKNGYVLPLICIALLLAGCGSVEKSITIPRTTIQEMVDQKFPYDKNAVVARFTLTSPEIYLSDPNIGMKLKYSANLFNKEIAGMVDFNGKITYRPEEAAFYMTDFDIVEITVDQANFSHQDKLKAGILKVVNNYLDGYPVYRLNQDDYKQNLGKVLLKSVRVKGDNVLVDLGLG
jgi:uncharacterized protein DUF1439